MSMSGLRDLSAITTAPTRRLPVHTVVAQQEKPLVSAALARELGRGGQVFYIHNRVNTIEKTAEEIRSLAPGARVAVAHGQMRGSEMLVNLEGLKEAGISLKSVAPGVKILNHTSPEPPPALTDEGVAEEWNRFSNEIFYDVFAQSILKNSGVKSARLF